MKQCPNCRGGLADFVSVCPICGVNVPVVQQYSTQSGWDLPPRNSNKAVASLICGILFLCWPASVAAIILGHLAISEIKKSGGRTSGQGLAVAGLAMGYLGIALTVVYVIAIAFGVRSAMKQSVPLDEAAAIDTMKSYNAAMKTYAAMCPDRGYPAELDELGPGSRDCDHANLVDAKLATRRPIVQGYKFIYNSGLSSGGRRSVFALVAAPAAPGITGKRYFFLDEAGVIRQSETEAVGPNSPPLGNIENGQEPEDDDDQPANQEPKSDHSQ